jgi:hypothetical protein
MIATAFQTFKIIAPAYPKPQMVVTVVASDVEKETILINLDLVI